MKVNLSFVPPGGGKQNYTLEIEMPKIPSKGDYLLIMKPEEKGTENFIVKRTWWGLKVDENKNSGQVTEIWIECEFALSNQSSESHKDKCVEYKRQTGTLLEFDDSMY